MLFNYCAHVLQRVPALPRAKIEISYISDADRAASPASPISSLVYRSRYPSAISSLVIPTRVPKCHLLGDCKTNEVSGGNAPNL